MIPLCVALAAATLFVALPAAAQVPEGEFRVLAVTDKATALVSVEVTGAATDRRLSQIMMPVERSPSGANLLVTAYAIDCEAQVFDLLSVYSYDDTTLIASFPDGDKRGMIPVTQTSLGLDLVTYACTGKTHSSDATIVSGLNEALALGLRYRSRD